MIRRDPVHDALCVGQSAILDVDALAVARFETACAHSEMDVGRAIRRHHDRVLAQRIARVRNIEDARRRLAQPWPVGVVDRRIEGLLVGQSAVALVPATAAALKVDRDASFVARVHIELVRRRECRASRPRPARHRRPARRVVGERRGRIQAATTAPAAPTARRRDVAFRM